MYFIYVFILLTLIFFLYKKFKRKIETFENSRGIVSEEIPEDDIEIQEDEDYSTQINQIGVDVSNKVVEKKKKTTYRVDSGLKEKLEKYKLYLYFHRYLL